MAIEDNLDKKQKYNQTSEKEFSFKKANESLKEIRYEKLTESLNLNKISQEESNFSKNINEENHSKYLHFKKIILMLLKKKNQKKKKK